MHSTRFGLPVVLTEHVRLRMAERNISEALALEIIDTGMLKDAGKGPHWLYIDHHAGSDRPKPVAQARTSVESRTTLQAHTSLEKAST